MQDKTIEKHITYSYIAEDDIHVFVFHQSTRQAVDEWVEQMDLIYAELTEDSIVRILMDIRESGALPVNHAITRGREWMNSLLIHPPAALVYLTGGDLVTKLISNIISSMRLGHLWVAVADSHDKALKLLRDFAPRR